MFNQLLTEIKEDLKELEPTRDNESCTQGMMRRLLAQERIKTKLQEWHRMASDEKEFLEDNEEIELECETCKNKMFIDTCADRELCNKCGQTRIFNKVDKIGNRIKELSAFIQEIEKIAKEQNIDLSQQKDRFDKDGLVGSIPNQTEHIADTQNQAKQENIEL